MKKSLIVVVAVVAIIVGIVGWGISVRNSLVVYEESVSESWAQVENVYKRRSDLIKEVVSTVQGAGNYEKGTLTEVIEARAKAGSVQIDANNLTPENLAQFQKAQDNLSGAFSRSINVVVERYPELTATQGFRDLQTQIEGCENRISTERGRFNEKVASFNKKLRVFPNNIIGAICGFQPKGYFKAPEGSDEAVDINFNF